MNACFKGGLLDYGPCNVVFGDADLDEEGEEGKQTDEEDSGHCGWVVVVVVLMLVLVLVLVLVPVLLMANVNAHTYTRPAGYLGRIPLPAWPALLHTLETAQSC
jgi:hypothetical protein